MGLARMQGKSVVVSGAAFGIGRATAAKFAEEGASLLVQDIQGRPLLAFRDELQRNGATVEAVVGDVFGRGLPGNDPGSRRNSPDELTWLSPTPESSRSGTCLNQQLMTGTRSWRSTAEACS